MRTFLTVRTDLKVWLAASKTARRGEVFRMLQKLKGPTVPADADPVLPVAFRERYAGISDYIACGKYPDGSRRTRSTVTLMAGERSGFRAVLNDRDNARSLWATGETLESLLTTLEAMLSDPAAPWRADKAGPGRK